MPPPLRSSVGFWQRVADHLFFPVNIWLGEETSRRLGLTPIDHERVRAALPHCRGRLLDIGCGNNLLVRTYGNGIGVDVHPYPEIHARCDSSRLPFKDGAFDSIALLACLNHITRRKETLDECRRVLRPGGRVLITMIPAWVGIFSHRIRKSHDPDQLNRGMAHDEDWGLSAAAIVRMVGNAGFRLILHRRFMWRLNNLYIAERGPGKGRLLAV
jgi:SAM-dependent methyltransferase